MAEGTVRGFSVSERKTEIQREDQGSAREEKTG